jgi:hypothetical protein
MLVAIMLREKNISSFFLGKRTLKVTHLQIHRIYFNLHIKFGPIKKLCEGHEPEWKFSVSGTEVSMIKYAKMDLHQSSVKVTNDKVW